MQQTILTMLALLIASLLSLNHKQAILQSQRGAVRAELTEMALGVAQQSMEVVRARAYDDSTRGTLNGTVTSASDLTPTASFPSGRHCEGFAGSQVCNDVDDFHQMTSATVPFQLPEGEQFDFTVDIQVQYVDDNLTPTGGPRSFRKKITIFVQDDPSGRPPRLATPIEYSEVVSYP